MDIEFSDPRSLSVKSTSNPTAPLISIYDTLIITFDPLSLAAVIRFNFHSQVAKCKKLAGWLARYYDNA